MCGTLAVHPIASPVVTVKGVSALTNNSGDIANRIGPGYLNQSGKNKTVDLTRPKYVRNS